MVKHIILWKLRDDLSEDERSFIKSNIKKNLEALKDIIDGIIEIKVQIQGLDTSNCDVLLDSTFEDESALKAYAIHPKHVLIAKRDVVPYVISRSCMDFKIM